MQRVPEGTSVPVQVRLVDRLGNIQLKQTFAALHFGDNARLEFNAPQGLYQMQLLSPQYGCYGRDFVFIIADHQRDIKETLYQGRPPAPEPLLIEGTAPASFLYLNPQYVLFPPNTPCNKPVPNTIPIKVTEENDEDSFYIWMYPDASNYERGQQMIALQLQTPTGDDHYIRLKIPFPIPWGGFPTSIQFNVSEDEVDWLSGQPTGVLLCPKLFRTSAG